MFASASRRRNFCGDRVRRLFTIVCTFFPLGCLTCARIANTMLLQHVLLTLWIFKMTDTKKRVFYFVLTTAPDGSQSWQVYTPETLEDEAEIVQLVTAGVAYAVK